MDLRGVVDRTQMEGVVYQWRTNGRSAWKIPILGSVFEHAEFTGKPSVPWTPSRFTTSCTRRSRSATTGLSPGSFNLSRSGEMNAENVLEVHDVQLAELFAGFIDEVAGTLRGYARARRWTAEMRASRTSSGSSVIRNRSRSPGEILRSVSSRSRIQSTSPCQ